MKNPADGQSRWPNYKLGYENMMPTLLAIWAATTITESYGDCLPEIMAAQETGVLATTIQPTLVDVSITDGRQWISIDRALTYERRIYMSVALRSRVTSLFHTNPKSDHFGALKPAELVSHDAHSPAMESDIWKYVAGCELCHQIKAPRQTRDGLNMPVSPQYCPKVGHTMDFITNLPESMASEYTGILVIVDCLSKIATDLPCRKDIDSQTSTNVFRTRDVQTRSAWHYHHWSRQRVYQLILGPSSLAPQYLSPTLICLPPTNGWSNRVAEPRDGAVPPSLCNYKQDN